MAYYTDHTLSERSVRPTTGDESATQERRLAYLLSAYPAVSHTFFLREIVALRARGFAIETASINPPDRRVEKLPEEEQREAAKTYYVKPPRAARMEWARRLVRLVAVLAGHPVVAARGLRCTLSMPAVSLGLRVGYWAEAMLVGDWMGRRSLGHLQVHFGGPVSSVALLTGVAWKIPWSMTLHGPGEFHAEDQCWLRPKLLAAARVFAISDYTRAQILRIAPEAAEKTFVIRLGVQRTLGLGAQAVPGERARRAEIVCTGRLVAAKGQRILLHAFAGLRGREGLRLVLIGDGPERAALVGLAARLGIAAQVEWAGALDHATTLGRVAGARMFVLASFAEGLPVALMEAMALGVPCISTYIAGIPELIASGENGLLVPAGNVDALRAAMQRMVDEPELGERLAERARQTVEAEYNLERNVGPLAGHLAELCARAERHG